MRGETGNIDRLDWADAPHLPASPLDGRATRIHEE
jgi:hypothetical protein